GKERIKALLLTLLNASLAMGLPAAGTNGHRDAQFVEGEVLVTFKKSAALNSARQALGAHQLHLDKHFRTLSQLRGRHFGLVRAHGRSTTNLVRELLADPSVESAEPNYQRWISTSVPNYPLFAQMWALRNTGKAPNGASAIPGDDI